MSVAFGKHTTKYLVKSEDLNHHGTLFAGRSSEWFVTAGFIAVAYNLNPTSIVCLNVHGIEFMHPVHAGHILKYSAQIVRTGRSTITVYVEACDYRDESIKVSRGFITFCHVDDNTKSAPHGLDFVPETPEEIELNRKANEITKK